MIEIKILGAGCPKCQLTHKNVLKALEETGIQAEVEKIEQLEEIVKYKVLSTPALLINNEIKIKGRVAHPDEIKKLLPQN